MREGKLTSWKEIAGYLECDESTARRWEQKNGLPVRRVGNKGGSVYAYTQEVDSWLKKQVPDVSSSPPFEIVSAKSTLDSDLSMTKLPGLVRNPAAPQLPVAESGPRGSQRFRTYGLIAGILVVTVAALFWASSRHSPAVSAAGKQPSFIPSESTKASADVPEEIAFQLKEFVKESQIWEMLNLYTEPWNCDTNELERYWLPGSKAFNDVLESVSRLNERGVHYGFGSRLLDFEFRYIRLAPDHLSAEVGTREHWWLPVVTRDGTAIPSRNPDQGPYEIDYLVVKSSGYWSLKSTNTPYTAWKPKQITCKNWPKQ